MIKLFAAAALVLLVLLQYRFWFGSSGMSARDDLDRSIEAAEARARLLEERNTLLRAEVLALRDGEAAVEARARNELGMIKEDEIFYMTDGPSPATATVNPNRGSPR